MKPFRLQKITDYWKELNKEREEGKKKEGKKERKPMFMFINTAAYKYT
jgi:hypothetical protein